VFSLPGRKTMRRMGTTSIALRGRLPHAASALQPALVGNLLIKQEFALIKILASRVLALPQWRESGGPALPLFNRAEFRGKPLLPSPLLSSTPQPQSK
jgi:hypothetical protein